MKLVIRFLIIVTVIKLTKCAGNEKCLQNFVAILVKKSEYLKDWKEDAMIMKPKGKKRKVVPLRSIEAHLGDRRYSSYSFLTSALEDRKSVV
jgi:hypothetical protein